jgi:hypothetical protein
MIINKDLRWVAKSILELDSTCLTSIEVTDAGCDITVIEGTLPSESDIITKADELKAAYESQQYARDRAAAYPSMEEQADMQYWDAVNGTTTWADAIAAVKAQYPKPE